MLFNFKMDVVCSFNIVNIIHHTMDKTRASPASPASPLSNLEQTIYAWTSLVHTSSWLMIKSAGAVRVHVHMIVEDICASSVLWR